MSTNFPTSVDSFPDPSATDRLDNPPHDVLHTNVNSAVEAIETALLDGAPLHIDAANGRVGIGTTSPSTTLDVSGTATATSFSGPLTGNVTGDVSGNAGTATKLATARTISLTGDVTGSVSFDGSGNAAITATVADDSHNHTIANVDNLQSTLNSIGLVLISTTNIGTNVSSVAVSNCFSSTYDHYIVILSCNSGNNPNTDIYLSLNSVTQSYTFVNVEDPNYTTTPIINRSSGGSTAVNVGSQTGNSSTDTTPATRIEIFDPYNSATTTKFSFASPSKWVHAKGGGWHAFKQSSTGFSIFPSSGTWTGGTVRVYGVKK